MELISILNQIKDPIFNARTLGQAQQIIDEFIETYQLNNQRSKEEYHALIDVRNIKHYHCFSNIFVIHYLNMKNLVHLIKDIRNE